MSSKDYIKLEKEYHFKRTYLNKTKWWINLSLVAPVVLLFGGLFGVMYLLNNGMLASWYSIPYVTIFAIGTIWFKTVRLHLQKRAIKKEGSFLVCVAQPIGTINGYVYNIFVTNNRRHDKKYTENLARNLGESTAMIEEYNKSARKTAILLHDDTTDTDFYLKAYFNNTLDKTNVEWRNKNHFPVLFIDEKNTMLIKKRHMEEYLA